MNIFKLLLSLCVLSQVNSYTINIHPRSNKIAYIKNIDTFDSTTVKNLRNDFAKYPLLIFTDLDNLPPDNFLNFVKLFDKYHDKRVIDDPLSYPTKMLQPFDQIPEVPNVSPRGYGTLKDYYNIKKLELAPFEPFKDNYIWHSDMVGHDFKLPNVVTGFQIIKQPLIGGNTDFISGETIYENLTPEEKIACENMLIEINRRKFITGQMLQDYSGVNRLEKFIPNEEGTVKIPLLYHNEESKVPSVLLMPTFFEKVNGWNVNDSRKWIKNFMNDKVLPHRISIQWKKGDIAVFNNRRFIHSSEPANNYLKNKNSPERLLFQTFIPTTKSLKSYIPDEKNVYAAYNVGWQPDIETSIISSHNSIKYAKSKNITKDGLYIVAN
jgi:hypothetical protein